MKICISSIGKNLSSTIDPRFGRCAYFLIVDSGKGGKFEVIKNTGTQAQHGAGVTAAQIIADKKVDIAISGNFGPNAYIVLSQAGIKCYAASGSMSAKEALQFLDQGKLQQIIKASSGHPNKGFMAEKNSM